MLELGRQGAVAGHRGPAVLQDLHLIAPGVDHRLDGEEHALAQDHALARVAEVQHAGGLMEHPAEPVAAEIAHHGKALRLGVALDGVADVAQGRARADRLDAAPHGLEGDLY